MNTKYFIEGYYGDDRPRKRGLNEIEGDYYDYVEMEDGEATLYRTQKIKS